MNVGRTAPQSREGLQGGTGLSSVDQAMGRYAAGEERAFAQIFNELAPRLQGFLRRLCGSDELAHDLTQETFLRMHRARASFVPGNPVVPWAYAIARNCFVSETRSLKSRSARTSLDIDDHEIATGLESNAEEVVAVQQSAAIVERTLAKMSVTNREAFILLRFEGQSVAEAAQILGASEGAVKLRAFRAYEMLREALQATQSRPGGDSA
jgi:RNA polymerase sigma-70 factor, ECF subfamily